MKSNETQKIVSRFSQIELQSSPAHASTAGGELLGKLCISKFESLKFKLNSTESADNWNTVRIAVRVALLGLPTGEIKHPNH